jgi:hypothetical protein
MSETWIEGRPDLADHSFGITKVAKFPKYVYSTAGNAMLVHKVASVDAYWYEEDYGRLLRLETPKLIARTACNMSCFIHLPRNNRKFKAVMCEIPKPDAVLCGACHGEPRPFGKHGKPPCTKEMAKIRLGCLQRASKAVAD